VIARIRQRIAARRLAKLVSAKRNSFEVADYRRRRAAALKGRRVSA
jgi:hypothetical protein